MNKKLFNISEEEKNRILEMHVNATKNLYLNEQLTPTTPKTQQQQNIRYTEVEASATPEKINSHKVLAAKGVPATPQNFKDTFFWTDRNGLALAFANKDLKSFNNTTQRTTKSLDNIYAKYKDGTMVGFEGSGTKEFPTKGLTYIGGSGNGLLALWRALQNGTGVLPNLIKITLSGEKRESQGYQYSTEQVNDTNSNFNGILPWFLKPYIKPQDLPKVNPTYVGKDIILGIPNDKLPSVSNNINSLLGNFLPRQAGKKILDIAAEYGLSMDIPELDGLFKKVNPQMTIQELSDTWNQVQNLIKSKYREELNKFLVIKFGEEQASIYMSKFSPKNGSTVEEEIKRIFGGNLPGYRVNQVTPTEKISKQSYELGK